MAYDADVWSGKKSIVASQFGARSVGAFALIEPAMEVWTIPDARKNEHDDPVGGIVLEVTSATYSDGEIVRSFRTYDYLCKQFGKAFRVVAEVDIERESITTCSPALVSKVAFRFAQELAKSKQQSLMTTDKARLFSDGWTLARTLMAGQW